MAKQDGERIVGKIGTDETRRDPRRDGQCNHRLGLQNLKEVAGVHLKPSGIAFHDQSSRDRIVGYINDDEENDDRQKREREEADRDFRRPHLGKRIARQHENARPQRRHLAGICAIVVFIH